MQIPARSNLLHGLQLADLLIIFNVSTEDNIRFLHSSVNLHIIFSIAYFFNCDISNSIALRIYELSLSKELLVPGNSTSKKWL